MPDLLPADRPIWLVRAGRNALYVAEFEDAEVAGLGWRAAGEDIDLPREELVRLIATAYPNGSEGAAISGASQLLRWRDEVEVGDAVATYDPDRRRYLLGVITSAVRYDEAALPELPRVRSVDWIAHAPRDGLSQSARNALSTALTLSRTREDVAAELRQSAVALDRPLSEAPVPAAGPAAAVGGTVDPSVVAAGVPEEGAGEFGDALAERADEAIEDLIGSLSPDDMEELAAGLLRGMGYRTTRSPKGADRGVDVFASPDGLGLEEPRVFVEVKHRRNEAIGTPQLRSFLGGRKTGDKCLYVSTGGFTKEAKYEADRSDVPLRLLALPDLRKLVVDLYPKLDEATRALVPLRRLYVPVE